MIQSFRVSYWIRPWTGRGMCSAEWHSDLFTFLNKLFHLITHGKKVCVELTVQSHNVRNFFLTFPTCSVSWNLSQSFLFSPKTIHLLKLNSSSFEHVKDTIISLWNWWWFWCTMLNKKGFDFLTPDEKDWTLTVTTTLSWKLYRCPIVTVFVIGTLFCHC